MIGGFRKKTKRTNIRKKITTIGSDDEEEGQIETTDDSLTTTMAPVPLLSITFAPPVVPPVAVLPVKVKKEKKTATKTSLSFGDELDKEDEFVLKRSKASVSLNEQVKREKKQKKKKENPNNTMECIKKSSYEEHGIILSQTEIPYNTNGIQIKTDSDIISVDDINPIQSKLNTNAKDNATHHFSIQSKLNNPGDLPDAATIYAMKKRREQARQFGGQINYIPLETNKHEGRFKSGSSRLVREEMDDSSDEDRIEMKGSSDQSHPALERRKQVAKALEEVNDNDEEAEKEDDELTRWEDEQMKKGSTIPTNLPDKKYGPKLPDVKTMVAGMMMDAGSFNAAMGLPTTTAYNYAAGLQQTTFASQVYSSTFTSTFTAPQAAEKQIVTVDLVVKRLHEQLDTKRQLFRLHDEQCSKTKFDLDSSKDNIVMLERKAVDVSDKFAFFQDIRGYIKDLLECLQEKVKKINELEDSMHQLLKKRADKFTSRRQNDVKDEVDQISGKMNTESERIANIKNRRIAEREGRRERRREARRKRDQSNTHHEGMSSDEEMITSDNMRFNADKDKILKESETIFGDVVADFTQIREIMNRFEQWKFAFSESYKEAFLGLCLPKLFAPYIKLQLLNWNPLGIDDLDFEDLSWYTSLIMYGHHEGELDEDDEDLKLIPNIIEKVLIAKLTVLIRDVWDPLSSKQTKLITFLFQRLVDDYPTVTKESKTTQTLVETIVSRLSHAVESEIYIPLYSTELLEAKNSHALTFLERQFWKGVKLLQNLMEWNWLLSQKNLLQLGVDAILNRYLIIALQQFPDPVSTLEKSKTVVNILPKEWFEKSEKIVAGMQSFARFLNGLASNVYKASLGYSDQMEQKKMKMTIKKIISLLMHIQAFDEARTVANTYATRKVEDSPSSSPRSNVM